MTKNPILTAKTTAQILEISTYTAGEILRDIKREYKVKRVTQIHLNRYLKI